MNIDARSREPNPLHSPSHSPGYLNEHQAAAYSGRSVASLRKDRFTKRGFPYVKLGTRIFYRPEDIDRVMSVHLIVPKCA